MRYVFWKPDLDTVLAAWLMGCRPDSAIIRTIGPASKAMLNSSQHVCLECGGSGEVWRNNFDHHSYACEKSVAEHLPPACVQTLLRANTPSRYLLGLVNYVAEMDLGLRPLGRSQGKIGLSSLYSGMRIVCKNAKTQLQKGLNIIEILVDIEADPTDLRAIIASTSPWKEWFDALVQSRSKLQGRLKNIHFFTTQAGLKAAGLKEDSPGVHGMLRRIGVDISIASGLEGRNFHSISTAAGKTDLNALLAKLNAIDPGWGGRPALNIIASPPEGSKMGFAQVCNLVTKQC